MSPRTTSGPSSTWLREWLCNVVSSRLHGLVRRIRGFDKGFSRKLHPDVRRIIVNSRTPMNFATLAPIIGRLQHDPRIEVYLTSSEAPAKLAHVYAEARPPFRFVGPRVASLYRCDAYLAADFIWLTLPRGTRRVQTFHGVAGKFRKRYDSPTRDMRQWDRLFFINELRRQRFIDSGAIPADSRAACLVGMPRLDCLVDGSLQRDQVLRGLRIDPSRKTVLYAPTWTAYSSLPIMGEEIIRRLGEAGFAVIVKLHDRSRDPLQAHSGGVDWGARLEPLVRATGGALAPGADASRYLPAGDVMISDHSSVAFEFLLLDRPLVRVELPELLARTDIEPTYVERLASASTTIRQPGEVVAAVERAFEEPSRDAEARAIVAQEMFYRPGSATERAVQNIYEIIELDRPCSPAVGL